MVGVKYRSYEKHCRRNGILRKITKFMVFAAAQISAISPLAGTKTANYF
jgi:hypothetical protein